MAASDPQAATAAPRAAVVATNAAELEVYGLRVRIESDWPEVLEDLEHDFAWFAAPHAGVPRVVVRIVHRQPDLERFGESRTRSSRRAIRSFKLGHRRSSTTQAGCSPCTTGDATSC